MEAHDLEPKQKQSASAKLGRDEAAGLAREASRVIVSKGKNVRRFGPKDPREDVVAAMLGPTGNLRAPTIKVGKTVLVGFDASVYGEVLGV